MMERLSDNAIEILNQRHLADALNRLAAYEDTGLTPEEVRSILERSYYEWCAGCSEYDHEKHCCPRFSQTIRKTVEDFYEEVGVRPETAREILDGVQDWYDANKEGRLIVLPCKVGDTVYVPVERCRAGINLCPYDGGYGTPRCDGDKNCGAYVSEKKFSVRDYLDIGKTVFLTREEAEAALKEAQP